MNPLIMPLLVVVALYGLHRFALHAEKRGWIYYTKAGRASASLGNAFLEVQSILEPSKRYVGGERRHQREEEDDAGDPPNGKNS